MPVERLLPDSDAEDLLALVREIATTELKPIASEYEAASRFPREQFRLLGRSGLLGLPYPEKWGGGAVSYEVYLQVLEEIAAAWMTVGVGLSVHTMSCYPLATFGTDEQRGEWLPEMLEGSLLGAYALSEAQAGSDAAALSAAAMANRADTPERASTAGDSRTPRVNLAITSTRWSGSSAAVQMSASCLIRVSSSVRVSG